MEQGRPSTTALLVALSRARHQVADHPKVFDDPLALRIIGAEGEAQARDGDAGLDSFRGRMFRGRIVVRSRITEDALHSAIKQHGVSQYVLLGAGLDTFAYRNPYPAHLLRVFEVDHPDTQAWKRRRLAEANIAVPDSLAYVPVNFETQTLAGALKAAGLRNHRPTFFSMLGVVPYIRHEAMLETFATIATFPKGSAIAFDCMFRPHPLDVPRRLLLAMLGRRYARMGEPWINYVDPHALPGDLRQLGFSRVESLSPEHINRSYFSQRSDGLKAHGGRLAGMLIAHV